MKPIILNMEEMSDSKEIYNSKPKSLVVYALYTMCVIMILASVLVCFLKVDNVVKGSGVLKDSATRDIINDTSNKRASCSIREINMYSSSRGSGVYVVSGNTIIPKRQDCIKEVSKFHVELYVSSYDVGEIKEGQEVKFELAAYPASKYGYCKGVVYSISQDAVVDEKMKASYYVVKVRSDNIIDDARGKNITLRNGMPCKGNIVVGKKTIMNYILEKI